MTEIAEQKFLKVFAQRLQIERRRADLTQEELAVRIDRSVDMVGRMERCSASPSFETLCRLADVFSVDAASLLTFSEVGRSPNTNVLDDLIGIVLSVPPSELPKLKNVLQAFAE